MGSADCERLVGVQLMWASRRWGAATIVACAIFGAILGDMFSAVAESGDS